MVDRCGAALIECAAELTRLQSFQVQCRLRLGVVQVAARRLKLFVTAPELRRERRHRVPGAGKVGCRGFESRPRRMQVGFELNGCRGTLS